VEHLVRAAVFHGNRDVRVDHVADPIPEHADLVIDVRAAGICGTDATEYAHGPTLFPIKWRHPQTGHQGPLIPGHEFAGVVVAMGDAVEGFSLGDLIVTGAGISCGQCPQCLAGRTNMCVQYATVGLHRHGGLAQYCAVPASTCVRANEALTPDVAALAQPMAIAVHAIRRAHPQSSEIGLVIGVGGIGAFLVYALADLDVEVAAVDLRPSRVDIATELGAKHAIRPMGTIAESAREAGLSPSLIFEATGSAAGLAGAFDILAPGGRIVQVGLHEHPRDLDLRGLVFREISIVGAVAHVCGLDLPEALRLLARRPDLWETVAPVALPLDRLESEGLIPLAEGRSERIKTLIDPWTTEVRPTQMKL
jgi:(R,R)-butanediol dehydrogenase/meso-butanediol dehydrogenase/diacetyl reductase